MTDAPTTRETADHIGEANEKVSHHIGEAATMIDHAELARLAEAATPGDLDTVPNPPSEYGGHSTGWLECPCCAGAGEVQGATFTNFDGVAIGVQFFGIGAEFGAYEAFFRSANPATVLSLLSEIAALRGEVERITSLRHQAIDRSRLWEIDAIKWENRATQAERQRDEAKPMLIRARDLAISYPANAVAKAIRRDINAFLANQGADQ